MLLRSGFDFFRRGGRTEGHCGCSDWATSTAQGHIIVSIAARRRDVLVRYRTRSADESAVALSRKLCQCWFKTAVVLLRP
jgi:hypothetical protein